MEQVKHYTQAYQQAPWRRQTHTIVLFLLVVVFAGLVAWVYLSVTARAAAVGRQIQAMNGDILELELDVESQKSQLARLTSAVEMEKRARSMGFSPLEEQPILYLLVPGFTGRKPANLAPAPLRNPAPSPGLSPQATETIFSWLERKMLETELPSIELPFPEGNPIDWLKTFGDKP
jgi:cell division protein FtsL